MRTTFDGPSEGRMGEPICTVIAHIEANGRVVDVTWCEGRWLVGDDGVPFARLLAWESAGSLDWVSEETRAWFHALPEVVGEERHPSAVRARESVEFARQTTTWLVCALVALAGLAFLLVHDGAERAVVLGLLFASALPGFSFRDPKNRRAIATVACGLGLLVIVAASWAADPRSSEGGAMWLTVAVPAQAFLFSLGVGELVSGLIGRIRHREPAGWVSGLSTLVAMAVVVLLYLAPQLLRHR